MIRRLLKTPTTTLIPILLLGLVAGPTDAQVSSQSAATSLRSPGGGGDDSIALHDTSDLITFTATGTVSTLENLDDEKGSTTLPGINLGDSVAVVASFAPDAFADGFDSQGTVVYAPVDLGSPPTLDYTFSSGATVSLPLMHFRTAQASGFDQFNFSGDPSTDPAGNGLLVFFSDSSDASFSVPLPTIFSDMAELFIETQAAFKLADDRLRLCQLNEFGERVRILMPITTWTMSSNTTGSLAVTLRKGKLRDSPKPGKDSMIVAGGIFEDSKGNCEPPGDDLILTLGALENPIVVTIPPDDHGWKTKGCKLSWKSAKGVVPKVKLVVNMKKRTYSIKVSRFDFASMPGNPIQVRISSGEDFGRFTSTWTELKKPGRLKFP